MPQAIDEQRMLGKPFMREGREIKPVMQMDQLAPPTMNIPHFEFPRTVYLHPNEATQVIEHQNDKFETVGTEIVPTEHLSQSVSCEAHKNGGPKECKDCQKHLAAALKDGWSLEPYINPTIASADRRTRNANLYSKKPQA